MLKIFDIPSHVLNGSWAVPSYEFEHNERQGTPSTEESQALGDIATFVSGRYASEYAAVGIPYLRVDNVRRGILNITPDDFQYLSEDIVKSGFLDKHESQLDDVIIARTATLGKAVLIRPGQIGMLLSQHLTRIIVNRNTNILPGWLAYYLNSKDGAGQLIAKGTGTTRLELTHEALASVRIPKISLQEQQLISDRLVQLLDQYYAGLQDLENAIADVNGLLGFTDTAAVKVPLHFSINRNELQDIWNVDQNFSGIMDTSIDASSGFELVALTTIADVARGRGTRVEHYSDTGMPFLRTSSLINKSFDPTPDHYATSDVYRSFNQPVETGDVLVSIEGRIGYISFLSADNPVVYKNHIERVRVLPTVLQGAVFDYQSWIYLILSSGYGKAQFRKHTVIQSTIPGLASRLRIFDIPIPTTDERTEQIQLICVKCRKGQERLNKAMIGLRNLLAPS